MDEVCLTVSEAAELMNCSERNVQLLIKNGQLEAVEITSNIGRGGKSYTIPLSELPDNWQLKYKRRIRDKLSAELPRPCADIKALTETDRAEIMRWKEILRNWREYRNTCELSKQEADAAYCAETGVNLRLLYRKWKALNERGEAALADGRGKHDNHARKLTPEVWEIFAGYWLDQSEKSAELCKTLTQLELERRFNKGEITELPELPETSAFIRQTERLPLPLVELLRHGEKRYKDKYAPHILRDYDSITANEIWIADNHTFDVNVLNGDKVVRPYLTAFEDARSRKLTGWCVTLNPSVDASRCALRRGIIKNGIPEGIYTDNGNEFTANDFGGRGFRRKRKDDTLLPKTILSDLNVKFVTAIPKNARAKPIERMFKTFKEQFSKLLDSYTGGNVLEKPDRLKFVVKDEKRLLTMEQFTEAIDMFIEGWYNKQPHHGEGMNGRTPDDVFNDLLRVKRVASEAQLNQLLMRRPQAVTYGATGVTLQIGGKKLHYNSKELWQRFNGQKVFYRYDPDDLTQVKVYDLEQRFAGIARLVEALPYNADKETVAEAQREMRDYDKNFRAFKRQQDMKAHDELALILGKAKQNLDEAEPPGQPFLNHIFRSGIRARAVGSELEPSPDWTAALEALKLERGNGRNER